MRVDAAAPVPITFTTDYEDGVRVARLKDAAWPALTHITDALLPPEVPSLPRLLGAVYRHPFVTFQLANGHATYQLVEKNRQTGTWTARLVEGHRSGV